MTNALTTSKTDSLRALIETNKSHIARALPRHLNADRMLAVAATAVQKTPALLDCDQASFVGAIIQCAQLGLEPNDGTGRAWLIPYGKTVQFIPGYRGLVDLTRRSGEIKRFDVRDVCAKDAFSYSFGLRPELNHVPASGERGELTHVYAVAEFKDGNIQFDVMTREDVEKIRTRSRAGNAGPWKTDYAEMAKKTIVRRICKMLPVSPEVHKAVILDERADLGLSQDLHLLVDPEGKPAPEPSAYAMPKEKESEAQKAEPVADAEVLDESEPFDEPTPAPTQPVASGPVISDPQRKRFFAIWKASGKTAEQVKAKLKEVTGSESSNDIPRDRYEALCAWAEAK